jgi:hypothetical protein
LLAVIIAQSLTPDFTVKNDDPFHFSLFTFCFPRVRAQICDLMQARLCACIINHAVLLYAEESNKSLRQNEELELSNAPKSGKQSR